MASEPAAASSATQAASPSTQASFDPRRVAVLPASAADPQAVPARPNEAVPMAKRVLRGAR